MIRISDRRRQAVGKDLGGFRKRYAVLDRIGTGFLRVPFELHNSKCPAEHPAAIRISDLLVEIVSDTNFEMKMRGRDKANVSRALNKLSRRLPR